MTPTARPAEAPGPDSWPRLIGWAAIAVLMAWCLFVGGAWSGIYDVDLRLISLVLAAAGIAGWILIAIRFPFWRPRTFLAPAFAVALGCLAITTFTSPVPRLGLEYLAWSVILTALYLILQRLVAAPYFRARILTFATLAAFVIGFAFLALAVSHWVDWWNVIGRVAAPPLRPANESLTYGNPSAVMTISVLLTASAVAYVGFDSRRRAAIAVAAIALSLAVTLLSGSRAGWLGLAIAVVVTGVVWFLGAEHRRMVVTVVRSRFSRKVAIPVLVLATVVVGVGLPGILARASAGGEAYRASFYAASTRMFEASPIVGQGPGTWAPQRIPFTLGTEIDYYIPHAHDIYLQTAAEMGILGILAGIVVAIALARLLWGAVRDPDRIRRRAGWCALLATIYFAAHQLLDFYANAPAILFAFAIPIAWLDATTSVVRDESVRAHRRLGTTPGRAVALIGVVAIVGSVSFLAWAETGAQSMQAGKEALDRGDATAVAASLSDLSSSDGGMPPYQFALGLALAGTGQLSRAETAFRTGAQIDGFPAAWLDLAAVRSRLGDAAGSRDALTKAMRLGRQQSGVALGAGTVWLELGDREAAIDAFAQALAISPSLAGDPWWQADEPRAEIWPAAYQRALARSSPTKRFELALEAGDAAGVEAAVASMPDPSAQVTARLIDAAWHGDDSAVRTLAEQARQRPMDGALLGWLRRIHARSGDSLQADRYRDWETTLFGGVGSEELRVSDGSTIGHPVGGARYYGHFDYRRPTPFRQLVPWLPFLIGI